MDPIRLMGFRKTNRWKAQSVCFSLVSFFLNKLSMSELVDCAFTSNSFDSESARADPVWSDGSWRRASLRNAISSRRFFSFEWREFNKNCIMRVIQQWHFLTHTHARRSKPDGRSSVKKYLSYLNHIPLVSVIQSDVISGSGNMLPLRLLLLLLRVAARCSIAVPAIHCAPYVQPSNHCAIIFRFN